jgi:early secretory antigenic target protein ESAT-6
MAGQLDYTRANFGTLQQAEADFSLAFRALVDELDDLDGELKKLLAPWVGQAGSTYETAKAQWNGAAGDMSAVLQRLGITIGDVHQNYSAAEKANNDLWSGGVL